MYDYRPYLNLRIARQRARWLIFQSRRSQDTNEEFYVIIYRKVNTFRYRIREVNRAVTQYNRERLFEMTCNICHFPPCGQRAYDQTSTVRETDRFGPGWHMEHNPHAYYVRFPHDILPNQMGPFTP